jgi:uncharacterized protein (DUF4415 family)
MPRYERELTLEELVQIPDNEIDFSDQPELGPEFWAKARVVMPEDRNLAQITAKFDRDMVNWFRKQGRGYQAKMNAVLRSYYEAHKG